MANVKALGWLLGFGGFSYLLFEAITPSDSDLKKSLPEGQLHHSPDANQHARIVDAIKRAATPKTSMTQEKPSLKSSNVVEK